MCISWAGRRLLARTPHPRPLSGGPSTACWSPLTPSFVAAPSPAGKWRFATTFVCRSRLRVRPPRASAGTSCGRSRPSRSGGHDEHHPRVQAGVRGADRAPAGAAAAAEGQDSGLAAAFRVGWPHVRAVREEECGGRPPAAGAALERLQTQGAPLLNGCFAVAKSPTEDRAISALCPTNDLADRAKLWKPLFGRPSALRAVRLPAKSRSNAP